MLVIRENTEGTYAGEGGFLRKGTPHEIATQGSVNTRMGVERCVRYAFDLAQARDRKHLTLVHKTNVLTFAGDLWQRAFDEVAAEYPDVATAYNHVDAACIYFVAGSRSLRRDRHRQPLRRHPHRPRRRGRPAASAAPARPTSTRPAPARRCSSRCTARRPTSPAPGRPIRAPAIISAAMMLEFLGEADAAARIRAAVDKSDDVQGSTAEIGDADRGEDLSNAFREDREDLDGRRARPVGRSARSTCSRTAALRHRACSRASAPTRPPTAPRCSGSPTTSSGCSTPPRSS